MMMHTLKQQPFKGLFCVGILLLCLLAKVECGGGGGDYYEKENSDIIVLNNKNFHEKINEGNWLIEFYAPWCGYCKRLAPIFEDVATDNKREPSNTKIGKVNCDDEGSTCRSVGISGYPTIKYFVNGVAKNYRGGRDKKDFLEYIRKMNRPAVKSISAEKISTLLKQDGTSFILSPTAPQSFLDAFNSVADTLLDVTSPGFFTIKAGENADLPFTFETPLVMIKDGEKVFYKGGENGLLDWAKTNQFPYLNQINENNFDILVDSGIPIVLGIIDGSKSNTEFVAKLQTVARKLAGGKFLFGYLDGAKFHKWISTFGFTPDKFPTVMVLDDSNELYWDLENTDVKSVDLLKWVESVGKGEVTSKTRSLSGYYLNKLEKIALVISDFIVNHIFLSIALGAVFLFAFIFICIRCLDWISAPPAPPAHILSPSDTPSTPAPKKGDDKKKD
eukprot:TRINITY_DN744_c0_g1_i1.p1 TRINITY_DN744_c0_g1~~TRINITY_DN744_c0_g1_i1.p1  ORF type:complete len:446 (-),score=93.82 TRINITY_DN744_c0_g1_i1:278-1615(-)